MSQLLKYLNQISAAAQITEGAARNESMLRTLESVENIQFIAASAAALLKQELHEKLPEGIDRVLLVKNDAEQRSEIAQQLRECGFLVSEVSGGVEAIGYLYEMPQPDMIITDMVMPDCDGWELIKVARTSRVGIGVLMVALTDANKVDRPLPILDLSLDNQTSAAELAQSARHLLDQKSASERSANGPDGSPVAAAIKNRAS